MSPGIQDGKLFGLVVDDAITLSLVVITEDSITIDKIASSSNIIAHHKFDSSTSSLRSYYLAY